jgi:hypothetical protein
MYLNKVSDNEVLKKFRSAEYRESVALEKGRILV